jgi:beta-galactosidase
VHEPYPGQFAWAGFADLERFVRLADGLGFLVLLRAGPYICAEHDFGGFPHWLASRAVAGGGAMRLRTSDPAYLAHVDRWWVTRQPHNRPPAHRALSTLQMRAGGRSSSRACARSSPRRAARS